MEYNNSELKMIRQQCLAISGQMIKLSSDIDKIINPDFVSTLRSDSEMVVYVTARYFDLEVKHIKSGSREQKILVARHLSMYLMKWMYPEMTLKQVAVAVGLKDHATVIYAIKKIEDLCVKDPEICGTVVNIRQLIAAHKTPLLV